MLEVIAAPEIRYPSGAQAVLARGPIAVVVDETDLVVLTVLRHTSNPWTEDEAIAHMRAS